MTRIDLLVSPLALTLVPADKEVDSLVVRLAELVELPTSTTRLIGHSEIFAALASHGLLPFDHSLRAALRNLSSTTFAASDIERSLFRVIDLIVDIHDHYGVVEVLLSHIAATPGSHVVGLPDEIAAVQASFWDLCAVILGNDLECEPVIIDTQTDDISIACTVHDFEFAADSPLSVERSIEATGSTYSTPNAGLSAAHREHELIDDMDGSAVGLSVLIYASRTFGLSGRTYGKDWTIGPEFLPSIGRNHLWNEPGLIPHLNASLAEIVYRKRMERGHALREGAGGNTKQRREGAYGAMRHDIDYEWHVHYWIGPEDHIQIASVVPHNDFDIPRLDTRI